MPASPSSEVPSSPPESFGFRRELLPWYLSLAGGIVPILVVGFAVSVLANRLVFIAWGVLWAVVFTLTLRRGFEWVWPLILRWAAQLAVLAGAVGTFGLLARRHFEIFDLGFRAVLPGLHQPWLSRPSTSFLLAAALTAAALALFALHRSRSRRFS